MGLLDKFDFTNPLPDFDVTPDINVSGFLPKFDTLTDFLPKIGGIDLKGFDFFGDMPTMEFSSSFNRGIDWGQNAFRSMLPMWGQGQTNWTMPWDKPVNFQIPGGMSGGIGSATGDFSVLNQYDAAFVAAAAAHGGGIFDANWLKAVAMMEGGWGPGATSGAGALGIMQIMPNGYFELQRLYPNWKSDPTQNIMLGAAILASKIRENGGNRDLGTERYLGVGVDPYTGISTQDYLARIKGYYGQLQQTTTGGGYGAPFTGQAGSSYLSVFGGVNYPISSQHAQHNGAPPSWYYRIDDELGIPIGTHPGLDVAMPNGTTLYMPAGLTGIVEVASGENGYGYDPSGGVARSGPGTGELRIRLSNGHLLLLGHMQRIYFVPGQKVEAGWALGLSGTAGSGAHVHMEYRIPGATSTGWLAVDPRQYLR